jgi:hypothetical protein
MDHVDVHTMRSAGGGGRQLDGRQEGSCGVCPWAIVRQGVGPRNRSRERDDVEAEAHRPSDSAMAVRRGRWGSSGSGSSSELWWCPGTCV